MRRCRRASARPRSTQSRTTIAAARRCSGRTRSISRAERRVDGPPRSGEDVEHLAVDEHHLARTVAPPLVPRTMDGGGGDLLDALRRAQPAAHLGGVHATDHGGPRGRVRGRAPLLSLSPGGGEGRGERTRSAGERGGERGKREQSDLPHAASIIDSPMPVLFVFVDGVGAGARDPEVNPLAREEFLLSRFADGTGAPLPRTGRAGLADACLGVPGRPQSATGQATLLTGENAPAALGRHLLGFPNALLRELLVRRSLFRCLGEAGRSATFANAYPVAYLRALGLPCHGEPEAALLGRRRPRASATTVAFSA